MSGEAGASASSEAPWVRGALRVSAELLREVEDHARSTYPSECCGFMAGPAEEPGLLDAAIREKNLADKYHELDPETYPRTSETYFIINALRFKRAFEEGAAAGRPIKVVYHSHCDAGAYFSAEDALTFSREGVLMWPCAFLVVSVVGGEVRDRKLWIHVPGSDEFEESSLEVLG